MSRKTDRIKVGARLRALRERITQQKTFERFLSDRVERLENELAPPAMRPKGETLKIIPKETLIHGRWYMGIGRGSNVAFWTGSEFWYLEEIMGQKVCNHWDDGAPFGCFQPFEEIEHRKYGKEYQYVE